MTAILHFPVKALWIGESALGLTRVIDFRGHRCTLRLPAHVLDFGLDRAEQRLTDGAIGGFVESPAGTMTKAAVLLVQVTVEMEGELVAADVPLGGGGDREKTDEAFRILRESADIGRNLVASVAQWARVEADQFWLEPQQKLPRATWTSQLLDSAGEKLAVGHMDPIEAVGIGTDEHALSAAEIESLVDRACNELSPPLPETLLADALFYAWRAAHPSPRLGLMLAAIACETKIKAFLFEVATTEQLPLVELILDNPRDVSVAAVSLFDKGLAAVAGISLREENRELYKAVTRLFEDRNRFAHQGDPGQESEAIRADLQAARDAFRWLDQLRGRTNRRPVDCDGLDGG